MAISCSRSMEADILQKVKRIDILSRSMEADMFDKRIGVYGYIL